MFEIVVMFVLLLGMTTLTIANLRLWFCANSDFQYFVVFDISKLFKSIF